MVHLFSLRTFLVFFLVLGLNLLGNKKILIRGFDQEELLESLQVETVLRNWVQHETEANHDNLGNTTKISEEIQQGVDSSTMLDGSLINEHNCLVVRVF